jgi:NTE family protein
MDEDASGLRFLYLADQLDNASFPNAGRYTDFSYLQGLTGMGSAHDYTRAELSHMEYFKLDRSVLHFRLAGGSSFGTSLPAFDQFSLGGLFSLSGYKEGQLRGNYYGTMRLGYFFRTNSLPAALGRGVYLGGFLDAGNTWWQSDDVSISDLRYAATLFMGIDTRLGPLYLAYGHAKDGNYSVYLSLGRSF